MGFWEGTKLSLGCHLLPLRHTAPPDMVTGGAGKLSVHGRDEVILGSLEHSKIGLRQGQQRGGYCLDILVLLHVLWWVLSVQIVAQLLSIFLLDTVHDRAPNSSVVAAKLPHKSPCLLGGHFSMKLLPEAPDALLQLHAILSHGG